jgi:hypothetical protein
MVRHGRCSMLSIMRKSYVLLAGLVGLASCYQEYQASTTPAPQFAPQPVYVQGPPGGQIDADYAYTGPAGEFGGDGYGAPSDSMATVTDAEIDTTLNGYGYWVEDQEYGRIWRPDVTVVGVDFTPLRNLRHLAVDRLRLDVLVRLVMGLAPVPLRLLGLVR